MGEWKLKTVAEIAEVIGGGTPKTKKEEYWGGDIPWLTPRDLSGEHPRYVSHGGRNITKSGLENSSAKIVPPKTVLLTSRAPVGYVALAKNPITTNQGFRSLVVNDENDPDFVYYLLLNNTDYLKQHAAGSTFQELSGSTLKSLEFLMPPLPEQKAIAHILGTLDDKIELNRRMNETLEGIARAIFKSWFVDFDPVRAKTEGRDTGLPKEIEDLFPDGFEDSELGEIPKGWTVVCVEDIAEKVACGPFGSSIKVSTFVPDGVPIISGQHLHGIRVVDGEHNFISREHADRLKNANVFRGDVVFTHAGNIGQAAYIPDSSPIAWPGWAALDGKKLREIRMRPGARSMEEYKDVLEDGLVFYVPNLKQPRLVSKIETLLASFRLHMPLAFEQMRESLDQIRIKARRAEIHRNGWGAVVNGAVVVDLSGESEPRKAVRKARRRIIRSARRLACRRAAWCNVARFLPTVYARIAVYQTDQRHRALWGLPADLVCTVQIQFIARIRSPDISGSTIERVGIHRIAWNKAWSDSHPQSSE